MKTLQLVLQITENGASEAIPESKKRNIMSLQHLSANHWRLATA